MWTQRIRTINRRPRLTTLECSQFSVWDLKEPTHYSQSVGHGASGVVVRPSAMWSAWCNLLNGLLIDETTKQRKKTDSSQIEGFQVLKNCKLENQICTLGLRQQPSFRTSELGLIPKLPSLMFIACNLQSCCRVPIIINSVLLSLIRSLLGSASA